MTPYEILGISPEASASEIKVAHREAVKAHHPDAGGDPADFVRAQRAYAILSDPDRRAYYDRTGIEDEATVAEEQQAHTAIAALVLQALDSGRDLDRTDVVAAVGAALRDKEKTHQLARTKLEAGMKRIGVLRSRLCWSGPGENGLDSLIVAREAALEAAVIAETNKLKVLGRALELLRHYSYSLDPTPPEEAAIWSALKASRPGA